MVLGGLRKSEPRKQENAGLGAQCLNSSAGNVPHIYSTPIAWCVRPCSASRLTSCVHAHRSVGVQGDQRTHSSVVALRAVTSSDGMTADWYPFEPKFLQTVSSRICNGVRSVNRVVYDITSKPPGTIEWE